MFFLSISGPYNCFHRDAKILYNFPRPSLNQVLCHTSEKADMMRPSRKGNTSTIDYIFLSRRFSNILGYW